jgi:thioredoxin-related protein
MKNLVKIILVTLLIFTSACSNNEDKNDDSINNDGCLITEVCD